MYMANQINECIEVLNDVFEAVATIPSAALKVGIIIKKRGNPVFTEMYQAALKKRNQDVQDALDNQKGSPMTLERRPNKI